MESLKKLSTLRKNPDAQEKCYGLLGEAMEKCATVKLLIDSMNSMGCSTEKIKFECRHCDADINGGFELDDDGKPGVVLCQNHIKDQLTMDRSLTHELIHAYDQCRAKVNWRNCDEHACSEVRAAALSGDCDWMYEFLRGNYEVREQHRACVKRRAELSLKFNEPCKGREKECVERVFETCYKDKHPFDQNH